LTDHHGYQQLVQIHDPPVICEREQHHVLHFRYRRSAAGEVESDFDLIDAPALAFAARATSSFPGAFPPARIEEIDQVVAERNADWPGRAAFIARNFPRHVQAGIDPASACFIDGSVLNNRPFREVDRRLVYIDPDPAPASRPTHRAAPGFFATLKGAISDIPRNQPVTDELNWVIGFNDQIRQLRAIIEEARPEVSRLVASIITVADDQRHAPEQIRAWREQVNARVARDAGFAYRGYVRLKLASVRAFVARLIVRLCDLPPRSPAARGVADIIDAWALRAGIVYFDVDDEVLRREAMNGTPAARWAQFFLSFDVEYRKRRLHFLIEGQNRLYQMLHEKQFEGLDPTVVDRLKRAFYERLDVLHRRERAEFFSTRTRDLAIHLFSAVPSAADARDLPGYARTFVEQHIDALDQLIDSLAAEIDLKASTHDVDVLLSTLDPSRWHPDARHEVLVNYLGFPFWDVLTFSVMTSHEAGELHEILIDRISPQDARALDGFNGAKSLKGIEFGHFAAFLSRRYRENDYLLGRLHALDRLIDIVCDCAGIGTHRDAIDVTGLMKRGFTQILDAEAGYLVESRDLIAALRERVAEMVQGCGKRSARTQASRTARCM